MPERVSARGLCIPMVLISFFIPCDLSFLFSKVTFPLRCPDLFDLSIFLTHLYLLILLDLKFLRWTFFQTWSPSEYSSSGSWKCNPSINMKRDWRWDRLKNIQFLITLACGLMTMTSILSSPLEIVSNPLSLLLNPHFVCKHHSSRYCWKMQSGPSGVYRLFFKGPWFGCCGSQCCKPWQVNPQQDTPWALRSDFQFNVWISGTEPNHHWTHICNKGRLVL